MPLVTTLNKIRKHGPCESGWIKLLKHLNKTTADDEPLPFSVIVESNGFEDALWCCRSTPEYNKEWRLFTVKCARKVQHFMTDPRSIAAIDVAERFANGEATDEELAIANAGAYAAVNAGAEAAVTAAVTAAATAYDAAYASAHASAYDAAIANATAMANAAAYNAAREEQKQIFLEIVGS
jgi:hypothetical protein